MAKPFFTRDEKRRDEMYCGRLCGVMMNGVIGSTGCRTTKLYGAILLAATSKSSLLGVGMGVGREGDVEGGSAMGEEAADEAREEAEGEGDGEGEGEGEGEEEGKGEEETGPSTIWLAAEFSATPPSPPPIPS